MYYAIWWAQQEHLYHGRKFENLEQLKQAIVLSAGVSRIVTEVH